MTSLVNKYPSATFGDLLTTTNNGQGLISTLENVQDGFGNNSPMQIATNAINFNRSGSTFQLDGSSMVALSPDINSVCKPNPVLPGTGSVRIPLGTTAQRSSPGAAGDFRYNTDINDFEGYDGSAWIAFSAGIATISGTPGQINVTPGPNVTISLANNITNIDSITGLLNLTINSFSETAFNGNVGIKNGAELRLYSVATPTSSSGFKAASSGIFNATWTLPVLDGLPGSTFVSDGSGNLTMSIPNFLGREIFQASHGFTVGTVLRNFGPIYFKAQANSAANSNVVGIVSSVRNANFFTIQFGGFIDTLSGLSPTGAVYYLDPTTAGAYTSTQPSASGQIIVPLFISETATGAYWLNHRGNLIP
jgi:hypothetical protein